MLPVVGEVVVLRNGRWEIGVLPASGAALAYGRVLVGDRWRDLLRPTRSEHRTAPERCASFPLVPWSNRIADGRLRFEGREWLLARNGADGTAIHGATTGFAWTVVARDEDRVVLELSTRDLVGVNFPWRFRARVAYTLTGDGLSVTTTVENDDDETFPAGFGHHPYFQRSLVAGGPEALLEVPARRGYALVRAMATGPAGDLPERADYRALRPVGDVFVDDCLTDLEPGSATRIVYPAAPGVGEVEVRLTADPVYSHTVVYAPRARSYFAVEPVTNCNGAFALLDAPGTDHGVFLLGPGEQRTGTFTLEVRETAVV
jgi:aldose 1-epimerase